MYIIQRLFELYLSHKNELFLVQKYNAQYSSKSDSLRMKLFHSCWFVSLIIEANLKHSFLNGCYLYPVVFFLIVAQSIRFYSVKRLGQFWTVSIMSMEQRPVYNQGLYQILRHPNYLAVILELLFLPLLFKATLTLTLFSLVNLFVLKKRMDLEERELIQSSDYQIKFKNIKRIIPLLY